MNSPDERMKYIGACSLLGQLARFIDDPETLACIEQAMTDCAEICEGRLKVVRVTRGWSLEPVIGPGKRAYRGRAYPFEPTSTGEPK